jgi:2-keto-myo-inositol isomerase
VKLCFNQITAGRQPPTDAAALSQQLGAIRAGGWGAIELWLRHWDGIVTEIGLPASRRLLDDAGLVAAGGCAQSGLFFSAGEQLQQYRDEFRRRLEQCQALGATHLVVTPGTPGALLPEVPSVAELERAAENLRWAADHAARYGVVLGIEFLKMARFVSNLPTALTLAQLIHRPNVGVVVDTFHLYAGTSKVEDLELFTRAPDRLSFVHVNDVPSGKLRELWADTDRVLPGEGSFPLPAIFASLRRLEYQGYLSLELFNDSFAAQWQENPVQMARLAYERTAQSLASDAP